MYVNSRSLLQENEYKVLELSFLFLQDRVQHLFIPRRFFLYDCIFIIYSLVLIIENRGLKTVKKPFLIKTMNVQFYLFSRRNIDKFLESLFVKSWYMNTMVLHVCQQKIRNMNIKRRVERITQNSLFTKLCYEKREFFFFIICFQIKINEQYYTYQVQKTSPHFQILSLKK